MSDKAVPVEGLKPVPAVGIVCLRGDEVLLVRRGNPPRAGEWSIPGGRIEPGETTISAALRELQEETSISAEIIGLVDVVDAIFENKAGDLVTRHYVLIDYVARWVSGQPVAGDDANEAKFFGSDEIQSLGLWDETLRVIESGRVIALQDREA